MAPKSIESFDQFLAKLRNPAQSLARVGVSRLSDLAGNELSQFKRVWPNIDDQRRHGIGAVLVEQSEEAFEFDFTNAFYVLLDDPDSKVRRLAIEGLWDSDSYRTADRLVERLRNDPAEEVRAEAAISLGHFSYLMALDKLDQVTSQRVQQALLTAYHSPDQPVEVRRRVLEALGYIADETINRLIEEAYQSGEDDLMVSAILAMGRACDPQWLDIILTELKSPDPKLRFEAAHAAAELEDAHALPELADLTTDEDPEVRYAAINAIGAIGGQRARHILEACQRSADPATRQIAAEALEEMAIFEEPLNIPFDYHGPSTGGAGHVH